MLPRQNSLLVALESHYGGKRAFALMAWYGLASYLGAFARYRRIDWQRVSRVIFVCKGNICRSAFAASRFQMLGVAVASAGLDADPGKPADPRAVRMASRFGGNLAHHRSTHIADLDLGRGDLLVAFEPDQAERLRRLPACQTGAQVTLLGLWARPMATAYLHDPYGRSERYFDACFRRIERGLEGLSKRCAFARVVREEMP